MQDLHRVAKEEHADILAQLKLAEELIKELRVSAPNLIRSWIEKTTGKSTL